MHRSVRWVWLARLAFLGTPLVFFFAPVVGGLILAALLAPGLVHYLIREDQASVKPRKPLGARGPVHDLALVFVGAPLVWVVLGLGGIPTSYDPAWTLSGLWMLLQCAPAASLLYLGCAELFPTSGKTPKPLILALPWLGFLSVFGYGLVFGYQGRGALLDQRFWLCLAMTAAIWVVCIRLVAASGGMSSGKTVLSLIKKGSGWYRRVVAAFIAAPVVWMLLWMSLCVHASLYGETPGLVDPPSSYNLESDSPPEGPSPLARSEPLEGPRPSALRFTGRWWMMWVWSSGLPCPCWWFGCSLRCKCCPEVPKRSTGRWVCWLPGAWCWSYFWSIPGAGWGGTFAEPIGCSNRSPGDPGVVTWLNRFGGLSGCGNGKTQPRLPSASFRNNRTFFPQVPGPQA